jgi:hypothetical protein
VYIYKISLIHSSVVSHLGCFHTLAIVNSAAINLGVHVSHLYPDLSSLDTYPGVVSQNHMAALSIAFCRISILLSIMLVLICIPITSIQGSCFSTLSPAFVVVIALGNGHSNQGEMKS